MSRTHPPTLLKLVERTIEEDLQLRPGDVLVAAVSGGPDSMALLHALAKLLPRRKVHLVAHGVDHGLRGAAGDELALAAELATELGVPFAMTRVAVESGSNLMARARAARYAALRAALARTRHPDRALPPGRALIATGHHADDRAETLVIRLLQGAGPAGLGVLPASSADLVRPLIRARRADVLAHLGRHRIPSSHDPTNEDPRFLRTRVRQEVMPLLAELAPGIVDQLCGLADALISLPTGSGVARGGVAARVPDTLDGRRLGRSQRLLLERALRAGNSRARVPLRGGTIARVDVTSSRIVLTKANDIGPDAQRDGVDGSVA